MTIWTCDLTPTRRNQAISRYLYKALRQGECLLVEEVLAGGFLGEFPSGSLDDKAYPSESLDETPQAEYCIELIAPSRR